MPRRVSRGVKAASDLIVVGAGVKDGGRASLMWINRSVSVGDDRLNTVRNTSCLAGDQPVPPQADCWTLLSRSGKTITLIACGGQADSVMPPGLPKMQAVAKLVAMFVPPRSQPLCERVYARSSACVVVASVPSVGQTCAGVLRQLLKVLDQRVADQGVKEVTVLHGFFGVDECCGCGWHGRFLSSRLCGGTGVRRCQGRVTEVKAYESRRFTPRSPAPPRMVPRLMDRPARAGGAA